MCFTAIVLRIRENLVKKMHYPIGIKSVSPFVERSNRLSSVLYRSATENIATGKTLIAKKKKKKKNIGRLFKYEVSTIITFEIIKKVELKIDRLILYKYCLFYFVHCQYFLGLYFTHAVKNNDF